MSLPVNYLAENVKDSHKRVFAVEFIGTDKIFTTESITGLTGTFDEIVALNMLPFVDDERVDLIENRNTISDISFDIADGGNEFTSYLRDYSIFKYPVRIYTGFSNIDWADYITIFEGLTITFKPNIIEQKYNISVGSKLKGLFKISIFDNFNFVYRSKTDVTIIENSTFNLTLSNLSKVDGGNMATGTISNLDTSDPNFITFDISASGALAYSKKVIELTSGSLNGKTYQIDAQTANKLTILKDQFDVTYPSNGDTVAIYNVRSVDITGNQIDFLNYVMSQQIGFINKTEYDLSPSTYGTYDYLDETFETIKNDYFSFLDFKFTLKKPEADSLKFLEDEIFAIAQIFLAINLEGKLFLVYNQPPLPTTTIKEIWDNGSNANILIGGIGNPDSRPDLIISRLMVYYDYDSVNDRYDSVYIRDNNEEFGVGSTEKHGIVKTQEFKSRVLNSSQNALLVLNSLKDRLFKRFGDYPIFYNYKVACNEFLEVVKGDSIILNSNRNPNYKTGDKNSGKKVMQVVTKKIDFENNEIELELFDTQFTGKNTIWADVGTLDYENATSEEQAFMLFYSDVNGQVIDENGDLVDGPTWGEA